MTVVAIVAAVLAIAAAVGRVLRARAGAQGDVSLEDEIERGRARFEEVIAHEAEIRAAELEQNLAIARSQVISVLGEEERRITEERRRDVAERERDATAKLSTALTEAQRAVEQRFADWGTDVISLQQGQAAEIERIGQRSQQLLAAVETKIESETERLESRGRGAQGAARKDTRGARPRRRGSRRVLRRRARDPRRRAPAGPSRGGRAPAPARARAAGADRSRAGRGDPADRHPAPGRRAPPARAGDPHRQPRDPTRRRGRGDASSTRRSESRARKRPAVWRRELELSVERFSRQAEGSIAERIDSELRAVEGRITELTRRLESLSARS